MNSTRFLITVQLTKHRNAGGLSEKYMKDITTISYVSYERHGDSLYLRSQFIRELGDMNPEYTPEYNGAIEILDIKVKRGFRHGKRRGKRLYRNNVR